MGARVSDTAKELVEAHLDAGNVVQFTVPTWSMSPVLVPGDRVSVKSVRAAELAVGDLVVQKLGTSNDALPAWIVHRLIQKQSARDGMCLVTKGDNAPVADEPWSETALSGRVVTLRKNDSGRIIDLTTRRARFVASLLAFFSGMESRAHHHWGNLPGRMVGRTNRLIGSAFVFWLAK